MPRRPKSHLESDPLWYKDAVIYQLHVKSFFDGNNDGIGDFPGLNAKLDYIASLGVNAGWLLPFYPSPRKDDGYDIAGYRDVSRDFGALSDFKTVCEKNQCKRRVADVIEHISADRSNKQLIDIIVSDLPGKKNRFSICYLLFSPSYNARLNLITEINEVEGTLIK